MPATAQNQHKRIVVGSLIALGAVFLVYLYFSSGYTLQRRSDVPSTAAQDREIQQLQARIATLETRLQQPVPQANVADDAYLRGLKEHEDLLADARSEVAQAQGQLKESDDALKSAKEATQRAEDAQAAFLAIFGILAALIVGQGYLQVQGWTDRAEESLKQVDAGRARAEESLKEVDAVKPDIKSITDARKSLESELPKFLDRAGGILEVEDATGPIQQKDIALINQIDHLTFLSSSIRFREIPSDDVAKQKQYVEALRVAARGFVARSSSWEAISRVDEFLTLSQKFPAAATERHKALAYSYRAAARYQLLAGYMAEPSWILGAKNPEITDLRDKAFADVQKSRECYPQENYADLVEAFLYSLRFAPSTDGKTPPEQILKDLEKVRELYRKLLTTSSGRKLKASYQNLACCLKRIAVITGSPGDLQALQQELNHYPSDEELRDMTSASSSGRIELNFLWQALIADSVLFTDLGKLDLTDYTAYWRNLLDSKVRLRDWKEDLKELRDKKPAMKSWAVSL